jgi:hypothetical protein
MIDIGGEQYVVDYYKCPVCSRRPSPFIMKMIKTDYNLFERIWCKRCDIHISDFVKVMKRVEAVV